MGFIKTKDPDNIRFSLKQLRNELVNDPYLKDIPSMNKTALTFHAKGDCPEVRQAVYRAYTTGEMRFFNTINEKVRLLVDLYDYKNR